jgi:exo-beta-1,3-glucanase (GH17 family)
MKKRIWAASFLIFVFLAGFFPASLSAVSAKPFYGLNFSPYTDSQMPKPDWIIGEDQIRMRLQFVKPYTTWIRTFSCTNGLENTGGIAHEMGLKTLVGAWLDKDKARNEKEIAALIKAAKAGDPDMVAVGNEVLLRGDLSEKELISYILRVKKELKRTNPNIKVSTVDGYGFLLKYPGVMAACDIVLINCYPFWEGIRFEDSIAALNRMYEKTKSAAKGKEVILSETGWPSGGKTVGKAIPSRENAENYLKAALQWAKEKNVKLFYFSSFDEAWKKVKEGELGGHWGIMDNNGELKYGSELFKNLPPAVIPFGSVLNIDGIYIPSGYMGDMENIKVEPMDPGAAGEAKYLKVTLLEKNRTDQWAGIYWQYPADNWGDKPGLELLYPKKLTFKARGEKGKETVEFKVGGIKGKYADSIYPAAESGELELSKDWKSYEINLEGRKVFSLIGGFCCTAKSDSNPDGCVIELSAIRFEW